MHFFIQWCYHIYIQHKTKKRTSLLISLWVHDANLDLATWRSILIVDGQILIILNKLLHVDNLFTCWRLLTPVLTSSDIIYFLVLCAFTLCQLTLGFFYVQFVANFHQIGLQLFCVKLRFHLKVLYFSLLIFSLFGIIDQSQNLGIEIIL